MIRRLLAIGLATLWLAGCAVRSHPRAPDYAGDQPSPKVATAATVLDVVATPVYVPFKAAVCLLTLIVAVPGAAIAVASLAAPEYRADMRRRLAEGVAANCGPPWLLTD